MQTIRRAALQTGKFDLFAGSASLDRAATQIGHRYNCRLATPQMSGYT
jgi:hypothetical protein